jgi:hypothetical protein
LYVLSCGGGEKKKRSKLQQVNGGVMEVQSSNKIWPSQAVEVQYVARQGMALAGVTEEGE